MKITVNTKPLLEALNLGIINSNVTKYYEKSETAQLKIEGNSLIINLEADSILSEIEMKGKVEDTGYVTTDSGDIGFVSSMTLKQLVSSFETATVIFEFTESGLLVVSGKSKFTLPYKVDSDAGLEYDRPKEKGTSENFDLNQETWDFVDKYQMYAIAMSFLHKVYSRVYSGKSNDVLVCDYDSGVYTHSNKPALGKACLLSSTIINLFNSLPEGAMIAECGDDYLVKVSTDSYNFRAEFHPDSEEDEEFGDYMSDTIIEIMNSPETGISLKVGSINKILSQSALLSSNSEDTIELQVKGSTVKLVDKYTDCFIESSGSSKLDYSLQFKKSLFKSVISNCPEDDVVIQPILDEDENSVGGVLFSSKDLQVVLAGVE